MEVSMKTWSQSIILLFALSLFSVSILANDQLLNNAWRSQQSNIQVQGAGSVIQLLADDNQGNRHQKFVIKLATGQTLLVAHNIDLAAKIHNLSVNDPIEFYGEYEWNAKGGVIHWTHRDPNNHHAHGWLKHKGVLYQ